MAHTGSNPSSETEYVQSNVNYENILKKSNTNQDYVNEWIKNASVETEVLRGRRLREEKPVPQRIHEYDIINIDFDAHCKDRKLERKILHNRRKIKTSPNTPRAQSPYQRPSSASSAFSPPNKHTPIRKKNTRTKKLKKKCSMRIAELAVPTKRQCIETWRSKTDVLPPVMIDRLKQHVMDQRPIVKIPEALYCFQRKRPQSSTSKKSSQSKSFHSYSEIHTKPLRQLDVKDLCIIFGHRIARRLSTPKLLSLSSKLEILSNIVACDIAQLMKCKQTSAKVNLENQWVLKDVSNKVTVWIADIMDDLSNKLLEEDLRVKHEKATAANFKEASTTTKIFNNNKTQTTELEEQEGPVLDFIDDVVDKVVRICETPTYIITNSLSSSSSNINLMEEESVNQASDTDHKDESHTGEPEAESMLSDNMSNSDYFRKKIEHMIINFEKQPTDATDYNIRDYLDKQPQLVGEDDESIDGKHDETRRDHLYKKPRIVGEHDESIDGENVEEDGIVVRDHLNKQPKSFGVDETGQNHRPRTDDETDKQDSGGLIELIDDDFSQDKTKTHSDAENNDTNVSDVFETLPEDSIDKDYKKAKFTYSGTVSATDDEGLHRTSPDEGTGRRELQWNGNSFKLNVMFTHSNEHLLNYVNELWPSDLLERHMPKLQSISKSVTSLGNIFEHDEQFLKTRQDAREVTSSEESSRTSKVDIFDEKSTDISMKRTEDKTKVESWAKHEDRGETPNVGYEAIIHEDDRASYKTHRTDDSWRVHPKSAPSWALSWGQGRGEPSEDSIPLQIRPTHMRESDVRKWCKDLEIAFCNLETWSDWISSTCKEATVLMKRRGYTNPCYNRLHGLPDWNKLKKNIKKDAQLWKKMYQRTEDNFKNTKKKYNTIQLNEDATKTCLNKTTILEMMKEFESLSIALHRMIVSAEYCLLCSCKKNKDRKAKKT